MWKGPLPLPKVLAPSVPTSRKPGGKEPFFLGVMSAIRFANRENTYHQAKSLNDEEINWKGEIPIFATRFSHDGKLVPQQSMEITEADNLRICLQHSIRSKAVGFLIHFPYGLRTNLHRRRNFNPFTSPIPHREVSFSDGFIFWNGFQGLLKLRC
uniref:Uncharacterized protein n=1 Tax=Cannabis sativa TaxID=3483 RepID=A0A803PCT5_CANSA